MFPLLSQKSPLKFCVEQRVLFFVENNGWGAMRLKKCLPEAEVSYLLTCIRIWIFMIVSQSTLHILPVHTICRFPRTRPKRRYTSPFAETYMSENNHHPELATELLPILPLPTDQEVRVYRELVEAPYAK